MSAIHKRTQRALFILIAGLLGMSLFAPIVALGNGDLTAGDSATISTGGGDATLRTDGSSSADAIGSIPDGTEVYIIEGPISDTDGSLWYLAGVWDLTGYISSTVLADAGEPAAVEEEPVDEEGPSSPVIPWKDPIDYGVVVDNSNAPLPGDGLACRVDAYSSAEVVVRLYQGQSVEVTGQELWAEGIEFLPVNCAGQGGFVKADYIALSSEPEPVVTEEEAVTETETEEATTEESETDEPAADVASVGDLIVSVGDQNGAAVAGVCFDLYSAAGLVASACDSTDAIPNNGNNGFFGVEPGSYTLVASTAPDGVAIENREVTIIAGDTAYVSVAVTTESAPVEDEATEEVVETEVVAIEEPAVTEEVVVTEVPVEIVTEEPVETEEVDATEVPAETETVEPVTEEPVATEVPATTEVAETEEPVETETEVTVTEEPAATETEVATTEEPAATETEVAATEEPVETEEPDAAGPDLSQALGDATVTGANGEGVRCRVAPDASSATIVVLPEGTTVFVLEDLANGYLGVACGDQLGYVDVNYMWAGGAGDEIPSSAGSVVVVGTGGQTLNCRTGAGTSFGVITAVPQGSVLTSRGASSNGWAPVVCGGQNGFVSISFVEASGTTPPNTGGNTDTTTGNAGTGTVSNTGGDNLRCRTSAPSGSTITLVPEGTRLTTRGAASGGWVPVVCGGQNGFVSAQFFTVGSSGTTNPTPTPAPGNNGGGTTSGYVKVTNTGGASLNCRSAASSTGMVITSIPAGSTVAVRGAATNGWQPVTCANKSGYVSTSYITATTDPGSGTNDPDPDPGSGSGQTGTAVVSNTGGDSLRCRTAPVSGNTITLVPEGTTVTTRGASSSGWTPVVCGGRDGFMSSTYLSTGGGTTNPTPTPTPGPGPGSGSGMSNGDHGQVNARANMRYQASLSANVVIIVDSGEVLLITGNATNGFYPVDYDGLKGFMSADLLNETSAALSERGGSGNEPDPDPDPGGGSSTGNSMVNYAMRYVGYPYVWATHGPSSFDCSGFTYWVTKNVTGQNIGTGLWTQAAAGTPVSRSALQPGDIVLFQNTYKAGLSHVGIYIGNNQFVHAENENTGVRVSDLNSSYYGSRWYGARRLG